MRCGTLPGSAHPVLVGWPDEAERRAALADAGIPRLLMVDPGAAPPPVAPDEDWIVRTSDERDVAVRLERLARRRQPRPAGLPPVPPVGLSPAEHRVAVQLASSVGRFVPVADLTGGEPAEDLEAVLASVRTALEGAGYRLTAVGLAGYLLELDEARET